MWNGLQSLYWRYFSYQHNQSHPLFSLVGVIYAWASDISIGGETYFQKSAALDDGGEIVLPEPVR